MQDIYNNLGQMEILHDQYNDTLQQELDDVYEKYIHWMSNMIREKYYIFSPTVGQHRSNESLFKKHPQKMIVFNDNVSWRFRIYYKHIIEKYKLESYIKYLYDSFHNIHIQDRYTWICYKLADHHICIQEREIQSIINNSSYIPAKMDIYDLNFMKYDIEKMFAKTVEETLNHYMVSLTYIKGLLCDKYVKMSQEVYVDSIFIHLNQIMTSMLQHMLDLQYHAQSNDFLYVQYSLLMKMIYSYSQCIPKHIHYNKMQYDLFCNHASSLFSIMNEFSNNMGNHSP